MAFNILVCIKSVVTKAPGGNIIRNEDMSGLNPFDRPALEAAIGLCEKHGGAVTALSMGPETSRAVLYEAMAMGVDGAVLISDPALSGCDTIVTSRVLAAAISQIASFDLVFFGTRTSDSDTGQVGPQTSVALKLPMITGVTSLETFENGLKVERKVDGFLEQYEIELPAALTIDPDAVKPRDLSLTGISNAFDRGKIKSMDLSDLGLEPDEVGEKGSPTRVISMKRIKKEESCTFIEGDPSRQAEELVALLVSKGMLD